MKINNVDELFSEIEKILPSVQSKTRGNPDASAYLDLYNKLRLIYQHVEENNFSPELKKTCEMSGPITHLYSGQKLSPLGEALCAINEYYQGANIKTLDKDEAELWLNRKFSSLR